MNIQKPGYLDARLKVCPIELYFCENKPQCDVFFKTETAKKIPTVLTLYYHMVLSPLSRKNTNKQPAYVSSRLAVIVKQIKSSDSGKPLSTVP